MHKQVFASFTLMFLITPLTSCNKNGQIFNMNDQVCVNYLSATNSPQQFKCIYNNMSYKTEAAHDIAIPYVLKCSPDGSNKYYYHIANDKDFTDETIKTSSSNQFKLEYLIPGQEYFWKITGDNQSKILNSGSFIVNKDNVRWINLPSVGNFRDLGGWDLPNGKQIKFGQLYRGRNSDNISDEDKSVLLDTLKIRTQIDLRKDNDSGHPGDINYAVAKEHYYYYNEMLAYDDVIERISEPLRGSFIIVDSKEIEGTFTGADMFKNIFETLANPDNYPVYFHCSAGADRTGSLAFLIEGLLGVSEADMTRDYELTSFCEKIKGGRLRREPNERKTDFDYSKDYFFIHDHEPPSVAHWPLLVDEMKVYGTNLSNAIENFLKNKCDVSQSTIDQVKANLIS